MLQKDKNQRNQLGEPFGAKQTQLMLVVGTKKNNIVIVLRLRSAPERANAFKLVHFVLV